MEKYRLDVMNKTLTISKAFESKMRCGNGDEYKLYTKLMRDIPGLTVVRQTHRTPTTYTASSGEKFTCNQFKNLSYKNMEHFMAALPEHDKYFAEYQYIRNNAGKIQTSGYSLVRRWFMAQFPQFRKNPLFYLYNTPALVPAVQVVGGDAA